MSSSLIEWFARRIWPQRLSAQINWVLALGLLLVVSAFVIAFHRVTMTPIAAQLAELIIAHVAAVNAAPRLGASRAAARHAQVVEVKRARRPPAAAAPPSRPFELVLAAQLRGKLGPDSGILFESKDPTWLWIKSGEDASWVGLPIPTFKQQATLLTIALVGSAGVMVLIGGAILTRLLSSPLRALADAAPGIIEGSTKGPVVTKSAPLEVRELASTLERAAEYARENIRQREMMLAGLSHDLRTPLTRLRYSLAISPSPDEELQSQMESDLEEMDGLVGLFLDLGRNSGISEPRKSIDLEKHIAALLPKISDKHWKLVSCANVRCSVPILALRRLLGNLIRNAEVHGKPPYELLIGEDDDGLWISIVDHGSGIPASEEKRLIEPFERGASTTGGSGLGLTIAVQLTEAMGGSLTFLRSDRFAVQLRGLFSANSSGRGGAAPAFVDQNW